MNEIILEMRKGLTALQEKVLIMAVYSAGLIEEGKIYKFSIRQFCEMCGISADSNRNRVIEAFKVIDMVSYRSTEKTSGERIKWFDVLMYEISGDIVSYSFFFAIIPHLNNWYFERMNAFLSPEALGAIFGGYGGEDGKE